MKRVARLLGFLGLVCLLASCGKRSFITDTSYRQRVEQDFNQKKERLPQGDFVCHIRYGLDVVRTRSFGVPFMPICLWQTLPIIPENFI